MLVIGAKLNVIHKWFVDNIQEGEDDCKEYYVDKNRLRELYEICVEISLLYENNKASIVKDRLTKLLPTQKGFLYGACRMMKVIFNTYEIQ